MDANTAATRLGEADGDATRDVLVDRLTANRHALGMPQDAALITLGLLYVGDRLRELAHVGDYITTAIDRASGR